MVGQITRTNKAEITLFTIIRTVINSGYRMVYPLLPLFASGLGVQLTDLGIAFSIRSILGAFSPFLASLTDKYGRKVGMLFGVTLFFLGSGIASVFQNFVGFVAGLSVLGVGNGIFIPSMQAYLSDHVPFEKRGAVISVTELSWSLGFIVGVPVMGELMSRGNWAAPFVVLTLLGLVLLIVLWRFIPGDKPAVIDTKPFFQNFAHSLRYLPVLAGLGIGISFTASNELINFIFGVWIKDTFGLEFAAMAIASIVIGTSELVSELLSTFTLDKIGKKRSVVLSLLLNCFAALLLPLSENSFLLALVGLGLFYISFEFALISLATTMSEVLPSVRATVMALFYATFSLGRMVGSLIGPSLYQWSFWAVCLTSILLNFLALGLINFLKLKTKVVIE